MQTDIKSQYDAALPGDLAVLPSFRGSAEVVSMTALADVYAGDPVYLSGQTLGDYVSPATGLADMSTVIGIAVRSHTNLQKVPTLDASTGAEKEYPVTRNMPIGIVINGPVWVRAGVAAGIVVGGYAIPGARDAAGSTMWVAAAVGVKTRFRFAGLVKPGNVVAVYVQSGAPMTA